MIALPRQCILWLLPCHLYQTTGKALHLHFHVHCFEDKVYRKWTPRFLESQLAWEDVRAGTGLLSLSGHQDYWDG